jgi:hypothetical protein
MAMILRETPNEGTSASTPAAPAEGEPAATVAGEVVPPVVAEPAATPAAASLVSGEEGEEPAAVEEPLTAESFTLAEGVTLDEAQLTPFLEIMNTADLTRAELAQKLVDYQVSSQTAAGEAADEAAISMWNDTQKEWQTEANALPDIGGAAMPQTLATIKKGLDTMGADKATYAALDLTGAGNHPAIVKILHALTKGLSETPPVPGSPPEGKLSQADRMYAGRKD